MEEAGAPAGPSEAEESAFLATQSGSATAEAHVPEGVGMVAEVEETNAKLPALDEMVKRIPPDVRELMDELFRARFVRVQRMPRKALHN